MKKVFKKSMVIAVISTALFMTSQASAIGVAAWGGYNMVLTGTADCSAFSTCSTGGIAFGGDAYLSGLGPIQLGVAGAYLPLQKFDGTISGQSFSLSSAMVPILAVARFDLPVIPIFLGGGVGYAFGISSASGANVSGAGSSFALGAFAGYTKSLIPLVSIEAGFRVHAILADTSASAVSGALITLTPTIGASLKF